MPYGMPKGLDTPEVDSKIEDCVNKVMASGKDKVTAIKICKASLIKSHAMSAASKGTTKGDDE